MYDIIVRFPTKELADEWCGQMSDGFGENFCDFAHWKRKDGTDGSKREHFEKIVGLSGEPVYFVTKIFDDVS